VKNVRKKAILRKGGLGEREEMWKESEMKEMTIKREMNNRGRGSESKSENGERKYTGKKNKKGRKRKKRLCRK
jgi:hypothetical protein